jgi:hypothetical protein
MSVVWVWGGRVREAWSVKRPGLVSGTANDVTKAQYSWYKVQTQKQLRKCFGNFYPFSVQRKLNSHRHEWVRAKNSVPDSETILQNSDVATKFYIEPHIHLGDRLCGMVVRVLGYRSGGPGSIPGTTRKKKLVCLERGPLSLVSTTEELHDRKVAAPV